MTSITGGRDGWRLRSHWIGIVTCLVAAGSPVAAQVSSSSLGQSLRARSGSPEVVGEVSGCPLLTKPSRGCFRLADSVQNEASTVPAAPHNRDHRYEGLVIGAAAGMVAGGLLGAVACGQSDDANESCTSDVLKGGLIVGGLGALGGLVIGGFMPKAPKPESRDSTR